MLALSRPWVATVRGRAARAVDVAQAASAPGGHRRFLRSASPHRGTWWAEVARRRRASAVRWSRAPHLVETFPKSRREPLFDGRHLQRREAHAANRVDLPLRLRLVLQLALKMRAGRLEGILPTAFETRSPLAVHVPRMSVQLGQLHAIFGRLKRRRVRHALCSPLDQLLGSLRRIRADLLLKPELVSAQRPHALPRLVQCLR
eukprot:scaffold2830_cov123-Isochrysis_galbana.AAC.8